MIMPIAPHAAVRPRTYYYTCKFTHDDLYETRSLRDQAYTECINLLDYSAVAIPVTKVDKDLDEAGTNYEPLSEDDAKNWRACMYHSPFPCQTFS